MDHTNEIGIKSSHEIRILAQAGKILAAIVGEVGRSLTVGMTTADIDDRAAALMAKHQVTPAFKGYRGFPNTVCVSVNNEIVHGIPGKRAIKNGDIVSIDAGIIYRSYYSDMATTVGVGDIAPENQRLIEVTRQSLYQGIEQARVGNQLFDISYAVQRYVEGHGFSVVRDFVGHGIGKHLHEDPEIPNFGQPHTGPQLKAGMIFAIEPMVNVGGWQTQIRDDGWTVVTRDGKPSAHFEHSIAITENGPVILTEE